jgi:hypothetical protein
LPLLLVLLVMIYLLGNWGLAYATDLALIRLARQDQQHGLEVSRTEYQRARISGFRSAGWTHLSMDLQFPDSLSFDPNRSFQFRVDRADGWLMGTTQAGFQLQGLAVDSRLASAPQGAEKEDSEEDAQRSSQQRIRMPKVHGEFPFVLFNPLPSLDRALAELSKLVTTGSTTMRLTAEGTLEFSLRKTLVALRIRVHQQDATYTLILDPADLRPISALFEERLTTAEMKLIAAYPLRAPRLLRIKDDAESSASKAYQRDARVPQDAYRHVLWSYLLTRAYGESFATRVTDAHEQGDTGNTPGEREMDYHNNGVGRRLAREELERRDILSHVQTDPRVMREPQ